MVLGFSKCFLKIVKNNILSFSFANKRAGPAPTGGAVHHESPNGGERLTLRTGLPGPVPRAADLLAGVMTPPSL